MMLCWISLEPAAIVKAAGGERAMHPAAAFDCAEAAAFDVGERAEHLVGEHRDSKVQSVANSLPNELSAPGTLPLSCADSGAVARQPEASRLDRELRELLDVHKDASMRARPGNRPSSRARAALDRALHRMPRAAGNALVHERRDRYLPSGVQIADQVFLGHAPRCRRRPR